MPEIPAIDPCTNLKREIDKKVTAFENAGQALRNQVTDALKDAINNYTNDATAQHLLDQAIAGATVDDVDAGSTAMERVRQFTGTCLNSVYNEAKVFATNVDSFVNDRINDFTSLGSLLEFDLLEPLQAVKTAMGLASLDTLLADIDSKLGCLADQGSELDECLSIIPDAQARIDDVLNYLGLGDDATWDLDTFMDSFNLSLPTGVLDNLKGLDTHMDNIVAEALENTESILPKGVQNWF
jgi:hypothetical protein